MVGPTCHTSLSSPPLSLAHRSLLRMALASECWPSSSPFASSHVVGGEWDFCGGDGEKRRGKRRCEGNVERKQPWSGQAAGQRLRVSSRWRPAYQAHEPCLCGWGVQPSDFVKGSHGGEGDMVATRGERVDGELKALRVQWRRQPAAFLSLSLSLSSLRFRSPTPSLVSIFEVRLRATYGAS